MAEEKPKEKTQSQRDESDTPVAKHKETKIQSQPESTGWNVGRIFWGLLLVLVGGLLLADNFGLVAISWNGLWKLWPLLIVMAGLSILSVRNWVWRIISVLLVIVTLAAIAYVAVGGSADLNNSSVQETTVRQVAGEIDEANISIKAGASVLRVDTSDQDAIADVRFESNGARLNEESSRRGTTQVVEFSMDNIDRWWFSDMRNTWDIDLTRNIPLRLDIDAGASDTVIDASLARLRSASIDAGASSIDLKVGYKEDVVDIDIDSGASSILVRIPRNSGVRLELDGGLTSKNLADLSDLGSDKYESPDYSQSAKKVVIKAKVGVASFTIERY